MIFHKFAPRPRFCIDRARRALVLALRVQEYFMSVSVNGSNANNPFAQWQALLQQDSSASSSAQSDPIASLLAAMGQGQGTGATAPSGGSSSTGATWTSGSSSPQFGAQTLQTLFDIQANGANSQSLLSQASGSGGPNDANSSPQAQQSQPGHHHHAGGANDGSTAAPTTAAPSDGSTSSASSTSSAGGTSVANNNLLERLIQMQAQLINPATAQNVATA
jgi:hypothetical protein